MAHTEYKIKPTFLLRQPYLQSRNPPSIISLSFLMKWLAFPSLMSFAGMHIPLILVGPLYFRDDAQDHLPCISLRCIRPLYRRRGSLCLVFKGYISLHNKWNTYRCLRPHTLLWSARWQLLFFTNLYSRPSSNSTHTPRLPLLNIWYRIFAIWALPPQKIELNSWYSQNTA